MLMLLSVLLWNH